MVSVDFPIYALTTNPDYSFEWQLVEDYLLLVLWQNKDWIVESETKWIRVE